MLRRATVRVVVGRGGWRGCSLQSSHCGLFRHGALVPPASFLPGGGRPYSRIFTSGFLFPSSIARDFSSSSAAAAPSAPTTKPKKKTKATQKKKKSGVNQLTLEKARDFVLARSNTSLDSLSKSEVRALERLCSAVKGAPLALEQVAAAYSNMPNPSFAECAKRFRELRPSRAGVGGSKKTANSSKTTTTILRSSTASPTTTTTTTTNTTASTAVSSSSSISSSSSPPAPTLSAEEQLASSALKMNLELFLQNDSNEAAPAIEVLTWASFLNPGSEIPLCLLFESNDSRVKDALELLEAQKFVRVDSARRHFSIHPLVPNSVAERISVEAREVGRARAIGLLRLCFPRQQAFSAAAETADALVPHVLSLLKHICAPPTTTTITPLPLLARPSPPLLDKLLNLAADWASFLTEIRGNFSLACDALRLLLDAADQLNMPLIAKATLMNTLGRSIFRQKVPGRFGEVESLLLEALQILREAPLPPPPPPAARGGGGAKAAAAADEANRNTRDGDVAIALNNLGRIYVEMGPSKYPDAETMYLSGLEIIRRLVNSDHVFIAHFLNNLGTLYEKMGGRENLAQAEQKYREALEMQRRLFPSGDHVDIATSIYNIGNLYWKHASEMAKGIDADAVDAVDDHTRLEMEQEKKKKLEQEGEELLLSSLELRRRLLPSDHVDIASSLNSLGQLYSKMDPPSKHAQAEKMYMESLAMRRRVLPANHIEIANTLDNIGLLFCESDPLRFEEAEKMFLESLEISRRLLPADHPDIASALHQLGFFYQHMEPPRFEDSEKLYVECLAMRRRLLLPATDHLDIATCLQHLGDLYADTMDPAHFGFAEKMYLESLEMHRRLLLPSTTADSTPDDPTIAASLHSLGSLYFKMGPPKFEDAERMYLESLAMKRRLFPTGDHPQIVDSLAFLGFLYKLMGPPKFADSEKMLTESLAIQLRLHHPAVDHPDIAASLYNLGSLYSEMEPPRFEQAESMYTQSLEMRQRLFPADHEDIANSLNSLGQLYSNVEPPRFVEAEKMLLKCLLMQRRLLPADHLDITYPLHNLGHLYSEMTPPKYTMAEKMFLDSLTIRRSVLPAEHPQIAEPLTFLGSLYKSMGRVADAEKALQQSLAILQKTRPDDPLVEWITKVLLELQQKRGRRGRK